MARESEIRIVREEKKTRGRDVVVVLWCRLYPVTFLRGMSEESYGRKKRREGKKKEEEKEEEEKEKEEREEDEDEGYIAFCLGLLH
ncbi:hypothetical protein E2C01_100657 [Portunus trituberculatus]|uniref:Uncharacterized protein n=1 Tax=Portunus trituberculatus TaxID=210409 RepID=A0A5B7K8M4_PORTR|nr:hypothetical protein [Portunus trituberculatus]